MQVKVGRIIIGVLFILVPAIAWAGDAATVIFKSGQVIQIDDGYRQIVDAMKMQRSNKALELTIGGGSFLIDLSEVVVVCRDTCSSVTIRHQLDPARGKNER